MATNKDTLVALKRIAKNLKKLGVKSNDLKKLNYHIGQQRKQIGWEFKNGKWIYHKKSK
jgi:hypothetical protein